MANITYFPDSWSSDANYAEGDRVNYAGTVYEARNAINANTTTPFDDQDNWRARYVNRINNIYSLIEAVKLQINVNNSEINGSIPLFIQLMEQSFAMRLRVPAMITEEIVTVDSEGRAAIPESLLEIINVRLLSENSNVDINYYNDYLNEARFEVIEMNHYEYTKLRLLYSGEAVPYYQEDLGFRSAGYWNDGEYLHFAPEFEAGSRVEITYYAQQTPLGYPILLTNSDGDAINSDGDTLAEWVESGNAEDDFVQDTGIQETNWFLAAAPRMCLYGAIMQAEQYLKDDVRWPTWEQQFMKAEAEVMELVDKFEDDRSTSQYFESYYPLG